MASGEMSVGYGVEWRLSFAADIHHEGASGPVAAAGGWRYCGRYFAFDQFERMLCLRIGYRICSQKRLRVRVPRVLEHLLGPPYLHDFAQVHDRGSVAY